MKLYIDTSQSETIKLKLGEKEFTSASKKEKSQRLLSFIDEVLKKERIDFKDLTAIEVNTGPGSFTGLRVGVAVANTLGWVLGIPVNAKDVTKETVRISYAD